MSEAKGPTSNDARVVTYTANDHGVEGQTLVKFEVAPSDDWQIVSSDHIVGEIKAAIEPAILGAKAVLEKIREVEPDEVEVKFAIKVSGTMNWLIAKAATEGNFEVTLTWKRDI